jgi:hypothetical protein
MALHAEGQGPATQLRLLPWPTPEGNPCYLSTEDPNGFLSRLADDMETAQLAIGADMLGHAREVVADPASSNRELRFTVARLSECLFDALRVADSRGGRLRVFLSGPDGPDGPDDPDDDRADDEAKSAETVESPAEACGVQ